MRTPWTLLTTLSLAGLAMVVATTFTTSSARAGARLAVELGLFQRFGLEVNFPDTVLRYDPDQVRFDTSDFLRPQPLDAYYSLIAKARFDFRLTRQFHIVFDLDSGELRPLGRRPARRTVRLPHTGAEVSLPTPGYDTGPTANGVSLRSEAHGTFFLRELFAQFHDRDEFLFKVGRARLTLADGLLYDDSALLLQIGGGDRDIWFEALLALPTPDTRTGLESPLILLKVEGYPERNIRVALWASYMHDGGDTYARALTGWFQRGAVLGDAYGAPGAQERLQGWAHAMGAGLQSTANLSFFGFEFEMGFGAILLELTLVGQAGSVGIQTPADIGAAYGLTLPGPSNTKAGDDEDWAMLTLGMAMDLAVSARLGEWDLKIWYLLITPDNNPLAQDSEFEDATLGFTGIRPRLRHTNLLFSGGMNDELITAGHEALDLGGNGLMAAGFNLSYDDEDNGVYFELSVSGLAPFALQKTTTGGRFYGVEVDLELMYSVTDWLGIAVEYDILAGGNAWNVNEPIHQLRVGLDITFGDERVRLR